MPDDDDRKLIERLAEEVERELKKEKDRRTTPRKIPSLPTPRESGVLAFYGSGS